jgi:Glycosyl transferases group 1
MTHSCLIAAAIPSHVGLVMRILLVGPTAASKRVHNSWFSPRAGLMFYCFANRLANGFVRNGHFAMTFNDRDSRHPALNVRPAAAWLANRRLLKLARDLQPDLLCLHHCDLISNETVLQIRKEMPRCRVAVVYYDTLHVENSAQRFRKFLEVADFGFATTAGQTLARFSGTAPVAFIPNPIDLSIDNGRAYAVGEKRVDIFCACGTTGSAERWELIDELRRLKPDLRYSLHARNKIGRVSGDAYYALMDQAKAGLNLNTQEGDLYASDRMAQYIGNGLLLATSRASGFDQHFPDNEMIFFGDAAELGDRLEWALGDDDRWRSMAQKARARAADFMSGERVTDFIIRMTMGMPIPAEWQFGDHVFGAPQLPLALRPAFPRGRKASAGVSPPAELHSGRRRAHRALIGRPSQAAPQ